MLLNKFLLSLQFLIHCYHLEVEGSTKTYDVPRLTNKTVVSNRTFIKLNVGGKEYQTTVKTLTNINNTYFTALFSKPHELEVDDQGRTFIDGNGDVFSYVLHYLRTNKLYTPSNLQEQMILCDELEYYQIPVKLCSCGGCFVGGTLLTSSQQVLLNEFYGVKNQQWHLLYKATVDGFSYSNFHFLCDDKGPTMTVIKSIGGYLFGGYTSQSWKRDTLQKSDASAFIFTLFNPYGIPPTKFSIGPSIQYAILSDNYGPTFGQPDSDIYIADNSNTNANSLHNLGRTYVDTTGKGKTLFTGDYQFQTSDIEVYSLVS